MTSEVYPGVASQSVECAPAHVASSPESDRVGRRGDEPKLALDIQELLALTRAR